uniref:Uncharacterized protein n=1 Tax=Vitis vinifera TaxID=29760 RepID=A5BWJ7_VITVI|nr:hypothetical protein VITISV_005160 [Vitis vinifera]
MVVGVVHNLGVDRCLEWVAVNAKDAVGGVLVFWDNMVLQSVGMEVGVYGPTLRGEREGFWEELGVIKGLWSDPWCVADDLNMIRFPSEHNRDEEEVVKLEEPFSGEQVLGALMGLNSLRDLRLLSLVGSLYKWLEKVLAYRLKKVILDVKMMYILMLSGCTPLHWAALRGNVEACAVLVHAGTKQELMVKDNAGFTPVELASDKGHRHVASFLTNLVGKTGGKPEDCDKVRKKDLTVKSPEGNKGQDLISGTEGDKCRRSRDRMRLSKSSILESERLRQKLKF